MRNLLIVISAIFIFNGCGGGGGDPVDTTTPLPTINLSGKAVDSHALIDSTVCLDLNGDNACQEDTEPTSKTDVEGKYTLSITEAHQKNAGYSTAKIVLSGGQDVTTGVEFIGTLSTLFDSSIRDNILLTPLSTLVALLKERNQLDREAAERQVASSFGLEVSQLSQDPLEALKNGDKKIFEANIKIQQSAQLIQSQDNLKKMEDIFKAFTENIGNQKEFTDGLGSEDKIKILQDFIDEELATLTAEALAKLNNDMRDLIAVTNSVDNLEFGLRDETNTTDFNTTQYIVNSSDLGDEYIDGTIADAEALATTSTTTDTPSTQTNINPSILAGKTIYYVSDVMVESDTFSADMTSVTWENIYGVGDSNKVLGDTGTSYFDLEGNEAVFGDGGYFYIQEMTDTFIILGDGTESIKFYLNLDEAKAVYESITTTTNTPSTGTDFKAGLAGKTFYLNDNGSIKSMVFNNDVTSLTITTIQGTDTDGNGVEPCQVIGDKFSIGGDFMYSLVLFDKYILFDNDIRDGILMESDMKFYFNQADAESFSTTPTISNISPSILAGKTLYFVSEFMIESDTFNTNMTSVTWENVYGVGDSNQPLGATGATSFYVENNMALFDYGVYFTIQEESDTFVILWNGRNSMKFYFDLEEAKAVYTGGSVSTTIEDNTTSTTSSTTVENNDDDNDGLTNDEEINTFHTDPQNPDTDGDGLLDGTDEVLATTTSNPLDSCDPSQAVGYRGYDNNNSIWQEADCDGDGVLNGTEDNISLTPNNYISDPYDSSSICFTFNEKVYCEVNSADGRVWLDRNLGATKVCENSMDSTCYGNLYQWGRGTDGHQDRSSTRTQDLNPQTFPYSSTAHELSTSGNFDWLTANGTEATTGFVVERIASWSSISNNSVCPLGFYVPTQNELTALADSEGIVDSSTAFSSPLKFPLSGSRSNASSIIEMANVEGYIWTTDTSDNTNTSYAFTYNDIETLWSRAYRATAYPVRCIKAQ